jgi:phage terminase large subunit
MVNQTAAERLAKTAFEAGSPRAQVEAFLTRGYVPYPWQFLFHSAARQADKPEGPVDIGVGGARGPGKSHAVFAQVALDDCQRVSNLKALFLRQTGKAASESFEDLIFKILAGKIKYEYNSSKNTLRFPNGSRVLLGGFENEKDIDKYIGIEYDLMGVEELNQLTKGKIDKLKGSLRTSKPNWRPRMYTSFNPGGIGHQFVKETYVEPFRAKTQGKTRFIPSNYKDNPNLNKEYIDYLEGLEGNLGKAWREGDWDIFEGQYFNEWRFDKHTCKPFEIPDSWKKFRAYDHGYANNACCLWGAIDYDGNVWIYRELYVKGMIVEDIAKEIERLSVGEYYEYSVADPAIFANTGFVDKSGGQTIAETFARNAIMFIPGSNRRVDGWSLMHQYLAWSESKNPKLVFFDTCANAIRTIPTLIHDELKPEDLDTDGEDHAADPTRYLLVSLHERKSAKPLNEIEKKLQQIRAKQELQPNNLNNFYVG